MHWILQQDLFGEQGWDRLQQALERLSVPYSAHSVVPFVGELVPEPVLGVKRVMCIGSYSMRRAAKRYGWRPGVFDLFDVDFSVQLQHWGTHMLNAGARVVRFEDAVFEDGAFVRPVSDSKAFTGKVFEWEPFAKWQRAVCDGKDDNGCALTADTLVQVCPPREIYAEYRYWIVGGRIVTRSLYKRGSLVTYSAQVDVRIDAFVDARVADWQPHEAFVVDVCETPNGLHIVEINTLNCAGFYAADLVALVAALEEQDATRDGGP